jgi:hypothetical protein
MQNSNLKPQEQKVIQMSDQLIGLLDSSADWSANYLKDHQVKKFMDKILQEKQVTVRRIKDSASRPLALGIFGASQCGKSYLVSELVKGSSDSLTVLLNKARQQPEPRDYIEEVNPAGGRESTAIVTRFTTRPYQQIPGCSAFIRLLSITDIIKIFLNGYLFECQSDFMPSAEELQKVRYSFRSFSGRSNSPGLLSEADVWDLQDYARRHFHNQFLRMLEELNYWGILNDEIRLLPAEQQITYLEWLWGKFPKITELFRFLVKELDNLGGQVVGIYDHALLPRTNSIIDVQRLSTLMKVGNRKCSLVMSNGGETQIDSSVLCALTSELILQTPNKDEEALLHKLDVLDFPGARARAQVFDETRISKDHDSLIEVFLRGKVAYLFDRYSDDRDVTSLLLCQEGGPQEAKSLPYMVNKWVEWSQGKDSKAREGKKPLLFHIFTKFDMDLISKRGEDPSVRWDSRLKTNFEDFFGRTGDWVMEWSEDLPFNNCYWVRNPNVQQTVFGRDKEGKEFIRDEEQLAEIKAQYLGNSLVQKHFKDPEKSWDQAATPGHSGIPWLIESIKASVEPDTKVKQLRNNLKLIFTEIRTHLQPYFIGDDISKARSLAENRGKKIINALAKEMPTKYSLPQILDLDRMSISDKVIGMIYDSIINPMNEDEESAENGAGVQSETPVFEESIFQVFGDEHAEEKKETENKTLPPRRSEVFAQSVLNRWQEQLAYLTQNQELQEATGLDSEWFAEISQEIIKGVSRIQLEAKIAEESDMYLNAPNANKFQRKTSVRVANLLNRFIVDLGQTRPEKKLPAGPPKATLSARAYPGLSLFQHWANSMVQLFKDNVAEASDDDEASNAALERILKTQLAE